MRDETRLSGQPLRVRRYAVWLALGWTAVIAASLGWNLLLVRRDFQERARMEARGSSDKDLLFQRWIAGQGGVYVPATAQTPPNPNLIHLNERDVETPSGRRLTLMNAAYVMRRLYAPGRERNGLKGHLASLKPVGPGNAPDPWEAEALRAFERGEKEISAIAVLDGASYMRLMRPVVTVRRCLKCHAEQGYKVGDIRGGFSVSVPMAPYWAQARAHMLPLFLGHGSVWLLGLLGLGVAARSIRNRVGERERAEKALRKTEERLRGIAERSFDVIFATDVQGNMEYVSPAVERLFLLRPEEMVGRHFSEFLVEAEIPRISESFAEHMRRGTNELAQTVVKRRDGTCAVVELSASPVLEGARPVGSQGVIRDITERKRAEEQRRQLEAKVQQAQKLESLGVLAGGIAHDFNNLLQAILGNADLALLDMSPVSPVRRNVEEIKKTSRRAAELANQMLAYSGRGRFVVESIDLSRLVREMSHMLEVSISKKAVLKYDFADRLPAMEADATQIRQVVINLITNASEAMGNESGIISISTGAMRVDRRYLRETYLDEDLPEGMYVTLEVADTGRGMDAETRAKLFDPFFTTKFTGRGLGMAAVLGIVRGHRGAIVVHSEVSKGATIKVLFPAGDVEQPARPPDASSAEGRLRAATVLLVDDEESVLSVGQAMLERLGLTVITASDGREAVDVFRNRADEIDCVILDLTMPRIDGEEAFRELSRLRSDVPVIMSSGYSQQEVQQRFAGKGVAGFVQKPYEMAALRQGLRSALGGEGPPDET